MDMLIHPVILCQNLIVYDICGPFCDAVIFAGILQSWSDWGEWSGSLRPCSEKVYQSRRRSCPHVNDAKGSLLISCCHNSSEDVEYSCCGSECVCVHLCYCVCVCVCVCVCMYG